MGGLRHLTFRNRVMMALGAILLAGTLLGLAFPVFLNDFDTFGIQINCGNGYRTQLAQTAPADRADQCRNAVTHRRVWLLSVAGLGLVLLTPGLIARPRSPGSAPATSWANTHPYADLHDAALLDRREHPQHHRPNTTL